MRSAWTTRSCLKRENCRSLWPVSGAAQVRFQLRPRQLFESLPEQDNPADHSRSVPILAKMGPSAELPEKRYAIQVRVLL